MTSSTWAFLDVETTGLSPLYGDRVCEVAVVRCQGNTILESFSSLVNPERPISPGASAVNGLTDDMVRDAPLFAEIAGWVTTLLDDAVIVCHNAPFDLGFVASEFARLGQGFESVRVVDTLGLAREYFNFPSNSLQNIASWLGIQVEDAHRALSDALTTREILHRFLRELGVTNLEELSGIYHSPITPASRVALPPIIEEAFTLRKKLLICYVDRKGETTRRQITPKQVLAMNDYVYLVAQCHLRDEERHFRLDRITRFALEGTEE